MFTNNYRLRFCKQNKYLNMTSKQEIFKAVENLQLNTPIKTKWDNSDIAALFGKIEFDISDEILTYNIDIKREVRNQYLSNIYAQNEQYKPFMLVAGRISPEIKKQLRANNVAYLEANGNFYLKEANKMFWIDANEPLKIEKDNQIGRASCRERV